MIETLHSSAKIPPPQSRKNHGKQSILNRPRTRQPQQNQRLQGPTIDDRAKFSRSFLNDSPLIQRFIHRTKACERRRYNDDARYHYRRFVWPKMTLEISLVSRRGRATMMQRTKKTRRTRRMKKKRSEEDFYANERWNRLG